MGFDPIKLATKIWDKPRWLDYVLPISATKNILAGEGDTLDYVDAISTFLPWGIATKLARGGIKGLSAGNKGLSFGSGGANMFGDIEDALPAVREFAGRGNANTLDTLKDEVFSDAPTPDYMNSIKYLAETAGNRTRGGQTPSQRASQDIWERMLHPVKLKDLDKTTSVGVRQRDDGTLWYDNSGFKPPVRGVLTGADEISANPPAKGISRHPRWFLTDRADEISAYRHRGEKSTPLDLVFDMVRASETKPKRGRYRKGHSFLDETTMPTGPKIPDKLREDFAQDAKEFVFKREQSGQTTTIMDIYQFVSKQWDAERARWRGTAGFSLDAPMFNAEGESFSKELIKDYGQVSTDAGKTFPMAPSSRTTEREYDAYGDLISARDRPKIYFADEQTTRRLGRQSSATDVSDPFNVGVPTRNVEDMLLPDNETGELLLKPGILSRNRMIRESPPDTYIPETMLGERQSGVSPLSLNQEKLGDLPDDLYNPQTFMSNPASLAKRDELIKLSEGSNVAGDMLDVNRGIYAPHEHRINLYAERLMDDPYWLAQTMGLKLKGKLTKEQLEQLDEFASRPSTYEYARVVSEQRVTASIYSNIENANATRAIANEERERIGEMLSRPKGAVWNYGFIGPRTVNAGPIDAVEALGALKAKEGGRLRILGSWQESTGAMDHPAAAMSRGAVEAGGDVQVVKPWASASLPPGYAATSEFAIDIPRGGKDLLAWLEGSHPPIKNSRGEWQNRVKAYPEAEHMRKMLTLTLGLQGYNNAISGLRRAIRAGDNESIDGINSMLKWAAQEASMVTGATGNSPLRGLIIGKPRSPIISGVPGKEDAGARVLGLSNRLGIPVHNRYPNPAAANYTPPNPRVLSPLREFSGEPWKTPSLGGTRNQYLGGSESIDRLLRLLDERLDPKSKFGTLDDIPRAPGAPLPAGTPRELPVGRGRSLIELPEYKTMTPAQRVRPLDDRPRGAADERRALQQLLIRLSKNPSANAEASVLRLLDRLNPRTGPSYFEQVLDERLLPRLGPKSGGASSPQQLKTYYHHTNPNAYRAILQEGQLKAGGSEGISGGTGVFGKAIYLSHDKDTWKGMGSNDGTTRASRTLEVQVQTAKEAGAKIADIQSIDELADLVSQARDALGNPKLGPNNPEFHNWLSKNFDAVDIQNVEEMQRLFDIKFLKDIAYDQLVVFNPDRIAGVAAFRPKPYIGANSVRWERRPKYRPFFQNPPT